MSETKPKFYLTTPIYYVNARPHLGHTYTTVVADTIARYKRMCGYDVILLTGTDEHGQKVERAAKAAGLTPEEFADRISAEYRALWQELDIRLDRFIRTTEWRHERGVHILLEKARDNGYVYKGQYEGQYCVFDELYVDDPTPGAPCPECGRPTERIREENYFFKLSEFQQRLLEHYDKHPEFVRPETRRNEVIAFVRGGLRDLSISRLESGHDPRIEVRPSTLYDHIPRFKGRRARAAAARPPCSASGMPRHPPARGPGNSPIRECPKKAEGPSSCDGPPCGKKSSRANARKAPELFPRRESRRG